MNSALHRFRDAAKPVWHRTRLFFSTRIKPVWQSRRGPVENVAKTLPAIANQVFLLGRRLDEIDARFKILSERLSAIEDRAENLPAVHPDVASLQKQVSLTAPAPDQAHRPLDTRAGKE